MRFIPYLNFNGQCAEAFRFYAEALEGEITAMQTHGDSPIAAEVPPEHHERILHARLKAEGAELMGSDAPPDYFRTPQGFSVSVQVDDPDRGERMFRALAAGGTETMPFKQTFFARRFGMLTDRYGIAWMINCP